MPWRTLHTVVYFCFLAFPVVGSGQEVGTAELDPGRGEILGHPGYLIISSARDTSARFNWLEGPGPRQLSLTWLDGMLTYPDSMIMEPFAEFDLAVPVTAQLSGAGASGKLEWRDGIFPISEPVMITDGVVGLLVSAGELEILGTRIRYRMPDAKAPEDKADPRASFLMLAGILLLIGVLLRRARKTLKQGA